MKIKDIKSSPYTAICIGLTIFFLSNTMIMVSDNFKTDDSASVIKNEEKLTTKVLAISSSKSTADAKVRLQKISSGSINTWQKIIMTGTNPERLKRFNAAEKAILEDPNAITPDTIDWLSSIAEISNLKLDNEYDNKATLPLFIDVKHISYNLLITVIFGVILFRLAKKMKNQK